VNLPALLLPLFLLTALGWALARPRAMASPWQAGLTELTAKLFIPAFLFSGAYKTGIPGAVSWQFLAAFFIPLLLLFLAAAYGTGTSRASAPRALAATYSNTVFVGIPVLTAAFGPDSLQYAFPVIAFHGLVAFTLYYLAAPHAGAGARLGASLANAAKNPIVLSLMLGLACNGAQLALPAPLASILALLSNAALPCALLALGAALAAFRMRGWPETAATVAVKLFLLPACVLGMALFVFRLPAPATAVLVVLAACPVGVNAAALVQADGKDMALVSSAILLSSLLCVATVPLWIWIVRAL
jgi:malonate transporter